MRKDCDPTCMHCLIQQIWEDDKQDIDVVDPEELTQALSRFVGETLQGIAAILARAPADVRPSWVEEGQRTLAAAVDMEVERLPTTDSASTTRH